MRKTIFAIGSILVIATSASAGVANCKVSTSLAATMEVSTESAGATVGSGDAYSLTLYLISDTCQLDGSCIASAWVYQEMNGIDGLQRQDAYRDDTCGGRFPADLLVF